VNLGITEPLPARRALAPGWRDPRLWLGAAIVAASVVGGALVLGTSDQTVPVWVAADSLRAGHVLTGDDLAVRRVHFADSTSSGLYFRADHPLPADLRLNEGIGAGELLPRHAVRAVADVDQREVPIPVSPGEMPRSVGVGDQVDVYVRPASRAGCADSSICDGDPVLAGVTVVDAPSAADDYASDGTRMLVVGMSAGQAQRYFQVVAATEDATVTVVGRG
jgi:hypothetical protein